MKKLTLIGGTDGFGKWLVLFLQKEFPNFEITITGRNTEKLENLKKEYGFLTETNNIKAVKDADITIFSVPIAYTEKIIKEVCPHLKKNSLVLDVTSIKGFPSKAMKKFSPQSVTVLPTHPMFGPFISTIAGQIFVLTPEETVKKDKRYIFIKNFLEKKGAKVIETTPKEHDKMMAVVQGLTHFDMFVLGETIKKLGINIETSMNFVSPIYKLMISSVARYVGQSPKLYGDIQMYNEEVLEVHKVFMEVTEIFNQFVKEKDEESFIETIENTKKYFGKHTETGQKYTDKIIYLLGQQEKSIIKNIGKNVTLKNIYSEKTVKGILEKFEEGRFVLGGKYFDGDEFVIV